MFDENVILVLFIKNFLVIKENVENNIYGVCFVGDFIVEMVMKVLVYFIIFIVLLVGNIFFIVVI